MREFIERAAVHELIKRLPKYQMFNYDRTESRCGINPDDVDFGVDKIPTADVVEVRHGHWIVFDPKNAESKECSMCGYLFSRLHPSNYCPNCGALMDGEDEHEAG